MIVPGSANALMLGQQSGAYTISKSLRFRQSASAYMNRTPASASNRTTWTWSAWVKRGLLGTNQYLFVAGASAGGGTLTGVTIDGNDCLTVWWNSSASGTSSTAVFRDPSAWYHIVVKAPSSTITGYVNNQQVVQLASS